jgi:hypothetical protein
MRASNVSVAWSDDHTHSTSDIPPACQPRCQGLLDAVVVSRQAVRSPDWPARSTSEPRSSRLPEGGAPHHNSTTIPDVEIPYL